MIDRTYPLASFVQLRLIVALSTHRKGSIDYMYMILSEPCNARDLVCLLDRGRYLSTIGVSFVQRRPS